MTSMTLTFGLNIEMIFPPWICVLAYQIWHISVSLNTIFCNIYDLCKTLTFDLKVNICIFFTWLFYILHQDLNRLSSNSFKIYPCPLHVWHLPLISWSKCLVHYIFTFDVGSPFLVCGWLQSANKYVGGTWGILNEIHLQFSSC